MRNAFLTKSRENKMGSGCSNPQTSGSEDSITRTSIGGKKNSSKLGSLQTGQYSEIYNKYQLSRQRWTTVRAFQKLDPSIMRNFAKIICAETKQDSGKGQLQLEKNSKDDTASPRNDETTNSDQNQEGKPQDNKKLKKFLTTASKDNEEKDKGKNVQSPSKKR